MAKFVEFKESPDGIVKIDVEKIAAYKPSANRAYPSDEYTYIGFGTQSCIYVNEPFEAVDRKIMAFTSPFDPDRRI